MSKPCSVRWCIAFALDREDYCAIHLRNPALRTGITRAQAWRDERRRQAKERSDTRSKAIAKKTGELEAKARADREKRSAAPWRSR